MAEYPKGRFKTRAKGINSEAVKHGAKGRVSQTKLEQLVYELGDNCFYCNVEISFSHSANIFPPDNWTGQAKPATFDHVVALSKGGDNDINNLVPCCSRCNSFKGNKDVSIMKGYDPLWP